MKRATALSPFTPRSWLDAFAHATDSEVATWDDCDEALVGYATRAGQQPCAVYDYDKLLAVFVKQGMNREDAREWVEFNIVEAYIGPSTPLILYTPGTAG